MPDGLDAELEENGRNLSSGQRQRLAVARAVVRDPRLVLLDEPTAFLDAEAAVALEKRLAAWGQDRLLILVTHHLAAARNADAILVLDQGRLVGFGAHTTLLADCAPYAALWSDYSRSMEGELT
jgi:ABC-type multidrug transport system fused ATPase/permease subunit